MVTSKGLLRSAARAALSAAVTLLTSAFAIQSPAFADNAATARVPLGSTYASSVRAALPPFEANAVNAMTWRNGNGFLVLSVFPNARHSEIFPHAEITAISVGNDTVRNIFSDVHPTTVCGHRAWSAAYTSWIKDHAIRKVDVIFAGWNNVGYTLAYVRPVHDQSAESVNSLSSSLCQLSEVSDPTDVHYVPPSGWEHDPTPAARLMGMRARGLPHVTNAAHDWQNDLSGPPDPSTALRAPTPSRSIWTRSLPYLAEWRKGDARLVLLAFAGELGSPNFQKTATTTLTTAEGATISTTDHYDEPKRITLCGHPAWHVSATSSVNGRVSRRSSIIYAGWSGVRFMLSYLRPVGERLDDERPLRDALCRADILTSPVQVQYFPPPGWRQILPLPKPRSLG